MGAPLAKPKDSKQTWIGALPLGARRLSLSSFESLVLGLIAHSFSVSLKNLFPSCSLSEIRDDADAAVDFEPAGDEDDDDDDIEDEEDAQGDDDDSDDDGPDAKKQRTE